MTDQIIADKNKKISKNLESMLVYYTKDIEEDDQQNYLKELIEEISEETQNLFAQSIKNFYNPRIDIQQRMVLPDDINKDELDFFSRKLLLLDRAGIKLELNIYIPLSFYLLLVEYYADALDLLIRNIEYIEDYELALNMLAVIFFKYDRKDESLEVLEEAIKNKASEDIIYYNAALLSYMIGNYQKAVNYLNGRDEALSGRSNFFLCFGDSLYNLGEMESSAIYFEKYLYKNPKNISVLSKLIDIYYEEENYSKALKYINSVETNNGDMTNMLFKKAVSLYFVESLNDSMNTLARLLGIEKKYLDGKGRDYLFGLFVECFRIGLSDDKVFNVFRNEMEAENWNKEMVDYLIGQVKNIKVNDPGSLCFLGILHKQTGDIGKAVSFFEEALLIDANNFEAKNWLGVCFYELGEKRKTIEIYQSLLLKNKVEKDLAYYAAKIYIENEDMHNAKQSALLSYSKGLRNIDILKMIGYIFIELKEFEQAYDFYLKAQKIEPQDLEVQNQIGVIHLLSGRYNDAALIFKRVVKKDPSFGEAHYNLGITYKKILEEESQEHIKKYYELSNDKTMLDRKTTKNEEIPIEE